MCVWEDFLCTKSSRNFPVDSEVWETYHPMSVVRQCGVCGRGDLPPRAGNLEGVQWSSRIDRQWSNHSKTKRKSENTIWNTLTKVSRWVLALDTIRFHPKIISLVVFSLRTVSLAEIFFRKKWSFYFYFDSLFSRQLRKFILKFQIRENEILAFKKVKMLNTWHLNWWYDYGLSVTKVCKKKISMQHLFFIFMVLLRKFIRIT